MSMLHWLGFKAPHLASNVFFGSKILLLLFKKIPSVTNQERYFRLQSTYMFHPL